MFDKKMQITAAVYSNNSYWKESPFKEITAPLWQQVIDWLREKYGLHIDLDNALGWGYGFIPVGTTLECDWAHFEDGHSWDYYEARKQAILKAIELCKN